MKLSVHCLALILSMGCGSTAAASAATPNYEGKNCRILGTVRGSSGFGKHDRWQRLAKRDALTKAEALDADDVVWGEPRSRGAFNGEVSALAYRCD